MFGGWAGVLEESGCERVRLGGGELTMHELWHDWVAVARKAGRMPTIRQYEKFSRYSVRPLKDRFAAWDRIPLALLEYGNAKGLWAGWEDVKELIGRKVDVCTVSERYRAADRKTSFTAEARRHGENKAGVQPGLDGQSGQSGLGGRAERNAEDTLRETGTGSVQHQTKATGQHHETKATGEGASTPERAKSAHSGDPGVCATRAFSDRVLPHQYVHAMPEILNPELLYGEPLDLFPMATAPENETGVVYLFGTLARELGFVVLKMKPGFPDCEALRRLDNGKWQRVRIEFEFESRNFVWHGHDVTGCELIVCWENNWPECPVEILELKKIFTADSRG